jgi:outer membrane protein insertion porin family
VIGGHWGGRNMKRICIIALLSLLTATTLCAQQANNGEGTESQHIERVSIRGNRRIPGSTIKSWIGARKGASYSPEQLDRDVRALHATGHFEDVKVYVEDGLRRGKIVTFELTERPLIHEIVFEGIDQDTQIEVREQWRNQEIDLSQDSEYDVVKVRRAAAVIHDVLVRRGDQRAKVNPMVNRQTATTVSLIFKLEE